MAKPIWQSLKSSQEFQSAVIRLIIWVICFGYLYHPDLLPVYRVLFAVFLGVYIFVVLSIAKQPYSIFRRYFMTVVDVTGASLLLYAVGTVMSPLILIYVWMYIGYGFRYGTRILLFSAGATLVGFSIVALLIGAWSDDFKSTLLTFSVLALLPFYQYFLQKKLEMARSEAEIGNRVKTEFLSTMSHELRTPLTTIIGMGQLLSETDLDDSQKGYLRSLKTASGVLRTHIQDVLDIARLGARELILDAEPFCPESIALDSARGIADKARASNLSFYAWISPRMPSELVGDELRLRQILRHLLDNAIKFTSVGEVRLFAEWQASEEGSGGALVFRVDDTGRGISEKELPQIFDRFWQGQRTLGSDDPGLGLGMTIVKNLVDLMGGEITVTSAPGEGSTFTATIPFSAIYSGVPLPAPDGVKDQTVLIESANDFEQAMLTDFCHHLGCRVVNAAAGDSIENLKPDFVLLSSDSPYDVAGRRKRYKELLGSELPVISILSAEGDETIEPAMEGPFLASHIYSLMMEIGGWDAVVGAVLDDENLGQTDVKDEKSLASKKTKVLVVEDDPDISMLVEALLQMEGCVVETVDDGYQALESLETGSYDLVLADLRMPGMDGQTLARHWRETERELGRIPVPMVALTAETLESVRQETLDSGMDGFLNKPVDAEQLSALLERFAR